MMAESLLLWGERCLIDDGCLEAIMTAERDIGHADQLNVTLGENHGMWHETTAQVTKTLK